MRVGMNVGGDVLGSPVSPAEVADEARRADAEGFSPVWSVHFSRGYDALTALAVAGASTERIGGEALLGRDPRRDGGRHHPAG